MGLKEAAKEYTAKTGFLVFVGIEYYSLQGDIVAFGIEEYPKEGFRRRSLSIWLRPRGGVALRLTRFGTTEEPPSIFGSERPRRTGSFEWKYFGGGVSEGGRVCDGSGAFHPGISDCHVPERRLGCAQPGFQDTVQTMEEFLKAFREGQMRPAYYADGSYHVIEVKSTGEHLWRLYIRFRKIERKRLPFL